MHAGIMYIFGTLRSLQADQPVMIVRNSITLDKYSVLVSVRSTRQDRTCVYLHMYFKFIVSYRCFLKYWCTPVWIRCSDKRSSRFTGTNQTFSRAVNQTRRDLCVARGTLSTFYLQVSNYRHSVSLFATLS